MTTELTWIVFHELDCLHHSVGSHSKEHNRKEGQCDVECLYYMPRLCQVLPPAELVHRYNQRRK